jgi:hypothetical protein
VSEWPVEDIPDSDTLFLRVHRQHIREDRSVRPAAFQDRGDGMSTDWSKYASASTTRFHPLKNGPENYGVLQMNVGEVRGVDALRVVHEPIKDHPTLPDNRAHSEVFEEKTEEVRTKLGRLAQWAIKLDDPIEGS